MSSIVYWYKDERLIFLTFSYDCKKSEETKKKKKIARREKAAVAPKRYVHNYPMEIKTFKKNTKMLEN